VNQTNKYKRRCELKQVFDGEVEITTSGKCKFID